MKGFCFLIFGTVQALRIAPNPTNFVKENFEVDETVAGIPGRQRQVWYQAALEEGVITQEQKNKGYGWGTVPLEIKDKVSYYGFNVPKLPRSYVEKVLAMNHTKTYRYMFSGSYAKLNKYRKWLPGFVKSNFKSGDYFRATDAGGKWSAMGEFDKSLSEGGGFRPKSSCPTCMKFDEKYWQNMVRSKFVVAPGGDAPYSFRFYEAILSGAIPLINDPATDWGPTGYLGQNMKDIGYQYAMTKDAKTLEHDQKMVDLNMKKFMRYQTFMEGDHNPEEDKKNGLYPTL